MIELEINNTYITTADLNIRSGPSTAYDLVPHDKLTLDGQKHSKGSVLNSGTAVTALEIRINPSRYELWIKIPSGWICGVIKEEIYIRKVK